MYTKKAAIKSYRSYRRFWHIVPNFSTDFLRKKKEGGDLLSHHKAVPSALKDFTSLFGMVKGVSPSLLPPTILCPFLDVSSVLVLNFLFLINQQFLLSIY